MNLWKIQDEIKNNGYASIRGKNCEITIEKRPAYCDRGDYICKIHPDLGSANKLTIDGADLFPRYFFGLGHTIYQMDMWLAKRKQRISEKPDCIILEPNQRIESFYDEKSDAVTAHINNRKKCWGHKFVNASLYWEQKTKEMHGRTHVSFENRLTTEMGNEWGTGHAPIRYCMTCKYISCIHFFEEKDEQEYRIPIHSYLYDQIFIEKCRVCGLRIYTFGGRVHNSTKEAHELIAKVAKDCGKPWTGDYATGGYGSNWYTELPSTTAQLLKGDRMIAEQYVRDCFIRGQCGG